MASLVYFVFPSLNKQGTRQWPKNHQNPDFDHLTTYGHLSTCSLTIKSSAALQDEFTRGHLSTCQTRPFMYVIFQCCRPQCLCCQGNSTRRTFQSNWVGLRRREAALPKTATIVIWLLSGYEYTVYLLDSDHLMKSTARLYTVTFNIDACSFLKFSSETTRWSCIMNHLGSNSNLKQGGL